MPAWHILLLLWISWVSFEIMSRKCSDLPDAFVCKTIAVSNTSKPFSVSVNDTSSDSFELETRIQLLESTQVSIPRILDLEARMDHLSFTQPPQRNFAAGGSGAFVLKSFTTPFQPLHPPRSSIFEIRSPTLPPSVVLDSGAAVGRCWEFNGDKGHIGIVLAGKAHIRSVTLNYPHPHALGPLSTGRAPRDFMLWGYSALPKNNHHLTTRLVSKYVVSQPYPPGISSTGELVLLVNSSYDVHAASLRQTFEVPLNVQQLLDIPFQMIVFEISSNWGSSSTCLYGINVYE